jgi:hypothetical protein
MKAFASSLVSAATLAAVLVVAACSDDPKSNASTPQAANDSGAADSSASVTGDASGSPDGASPSGGSFSLTAKASPAPPAGSKAIVIWTVSSGSPDYSYAFGGGTTTGSDVFVTFSSDPPAEALNAGALGVGIPALVDAAANVPEGKLPKEQLQGITYAAPNHAIIFRSGTETVLKNGWDASFPQGFACGACERHDAGFDAYTKVDCGAIELVPYTPDLDFCNWT